MYKNKIKTLFLLSFLIFSLFSYLNVNSNYSFLPNNNLNVSNKKNLDIFLNKVYESRKNFNSINSYLNFLDSVSLKIDTLNTKFSWNSKIIEMLSYLKSWILNIRVIVSNENDIDNFLCDILWTCNQNSDSIILSHQEIVSKLQKSNYYKDEIIDFYLKWFWNTPNTLRTCMEILWDSDSSCNLDKNWVSPPNDWSYIWDNTWKNEWFKLSSVPAWKTYKWYWKDISTGKKSNTIEVRILDEYRPIEIWAEYWHYDTITKSQRTSYYKNETIDFYLTWFWNTPNTLRTCMEKLWDSETSCNLDKNWVSPPNDWSYAWNNTWKNEWFKLSNIPSWTYKWYWKDISTNKSSNIITITLLSHEKPLYFKTSNINYSWTNKLDVYLPSNVSTTAKIPVYLMLHWWAWYTWDKWDVDTTIVDFWKYFTKNWVAYVPMDYSLATATKSSYDLVYKEISCALNWINTNKDKYNFDTDKINLLWWSAWWHLVLQYALNQSNYVWTDCSWWNEKININQIVSVAGITDLTKDFSNTEAWNLNPYLEYFLWAKKWTEIINQRIYNNSPINFINKDNKNKKYYLFHAKNDGVVNYQEHAVPFFNLLKNNNYNVILDSWFDNHNAITIPEISIKKVLNQ